MLMQNNGISNILPMSCAKKHLTV